MTRITLADKERSLEQRKSALGITGRDYVTPNSGSRRTPEKRDLLRTIRRSARDRGVAPVFQAAIG